MRILKVLSLLVCLGIFITGMDLLEDYQSSSTYVVYSGDVTFNTVEEYTVFKEYLLVPDVTIKHIQILKLEPPVLVKYRVEFLRAKEFPFTYDSIVASTSGIEVVYGVIVAIGFVGSSLMAGWIFSKDENKEVR